MIGPSSRWFRFVVLACAVLYFQPAGAFLAYNLSIDLAWPPSTEYELDDDFTKFPCRYAPIPGPDEFRTEFRLQGTSLRFEFDQYDGSKPGWWFDVSYYIGRFSDDYLVEPDSWAYLGSSGYENIPKGYRCTEPIDVWRGIVDDTSSNFEFKSNTTYAEQLSYVPAMLGVRVTLSDDHYIPVGGRVQCAYVTLVPASSPLVQDPGLCNSQYPVTSLTTSPATSSTTSQPTDPISYSSSNPDGPDARSIIISICVLVGVPAAIVVFTVCWKLRRKKEKRSQATNASIPLPDLAATHPEPSPVYTKHPQPQVWEGVDGRHSLGGGPSGSGSGSGTIHAEEPPPYRE